MPKPPRRNPPRNTPRRPPRPAPPPAQPPSNPVSPWVQFRSPTHNPLVYQRMIANTDPAAHAGQVVNLYDRHGTFAGRGLYNPKSQITVRVLTHRDQPIDQAFWTRQIAAALNLRTQLRIPDHTDAYRLVHAEGDQLSGLVVERYADTLVLEFFSRGMYDHRDPILTALTTLLPRPAGLDRPDKVADQWRIILRVPDRIAALEGFAPPPPPADPGPRLIIREHDIRYRVDPVAGHKTGFFCDQRDNRRRLADFCRDAEVLDLCCYTGGFSLNAALRGAAREVTAVDLDEAALEIARENANLNQARINFTHADAFTWLRQIIANQRQFDVVILDPPKLALTRRDLEDALKKYHDLNRLALQVLRPGGLFLTCSCTGLVSTDEFLKTVYAASRRASRPLQRFDLTFAAPDHPVALNCPESAYLKVAWHRALPR